jgi:hypothetical protein
MELLIWTVLALSASAVGDAISEPRLSIYGLCPRRVNGEDDESILRGLYDATRSLPFLAGFSSPKPDLHLVSIPAPLDISVAADDRIGVPARAAMMARSRRSYSDLGDRRAVALYIAHAEAWKMIAEGNAPLALVILDPSTLSGDDTKQPPEHLSAFEALLGEMGDANEAVEDNGLSASVWDIALLSSQSAPLDAARQGARLWSFTAGKLAKAGWRVPVAWRGWDAYLLTRRGARILISNGALPMTSRSESHASSLIALGLLRGVFLPASSLIRRTPPGQGVESEWQSAADADAATPTMKSLLFESKCDLCTLPQDYSRTGRYFRIALPALLVGYVLTTLVRMLAAKTIAPAGAGAGTGARRGTVLPTTVKADLCSL